MSKKFIAIVLLLFPSLCVAQSYQSLSLKNANFSLSLPVMTASGDGTLYVAFRSFDWLKRSNELVVLSYDIKSRREINRKNFSVPSVRGPRVANGLFASKDGQLAYVEIHNPCLILLIATQDLSEIRRSNSPLFTGKDRQETFGGFDSNGFLSFAADGPAGLRFIRVDKANLRVVSDMTATAVHQERSQRIVWSPVLKTTWAFKPPAVGSDEWLQYTEEGRATDQKLVADQGAPNGADIIGENCLVAFFGNMTDAGSVVSYHDHRTTNLRVQCLPHQYGVSEDREYVGAICTTSPDRESEKGGNKIVSSEFLLFGTKGPVLIWRHKMTYTDLAQKTDDDVWIHQDGAPVIIQSLGKAWIVAPGKSPELNIYEATLPEANTAPIPTTR